ncbi:MAG: NADH-quinone oxidoreductase subunit J [Acidimicrobiia bacterium]|nr:NADH-quinone oxidoreductase subunit J [Acidimicrobiia bacterium]
MIVADALVAQNVFFGIIALVMIVAALRVVTTTNVVHAALYLVVVLAGVAALFVLTMAEFTAVTQVLVYIGAVIVLFLFGIMLTQAKIGRDLELDNERRWLAALVAVILAGVMGYALLDGFDDTMLDDKGALEVQTTAEVSDAIFRDYLIPFEVVSVLLLAALIGAVVVGRRE